MLAGLSAVTLAPLQRVMHVAVSLVAHLRIHDAGTASIQAPHWLPFIYRIEESCQRLESGLHHWNTHTDFVFTQPCATVIIDVLYLWVDRLQQTKTQTRYDWLYMDCIQIQLHLSSPRQQLVNHWLVLKKRLTLNSTSQTCVVTVIFSWDSFMWFGDLCHQTHCEHFFIHLLRVILTCNSLFFGLPACDICRLQSMQNSAAYLFGGLAKHDHVTAVLGDKLYWLSIWKGNDLTVAVLIRNYINELAS